MKFFVSYFLLNFIFFVQASENLTNIIRQRLKEDKKQITIHLEKHEEYYFDGKVSVSKLDVFTLIGTGQSVTCNQVNEPIVMLSISNVIHVSIEGIHFNNCNKNVTIKDQPEENLGFIMFIFCETIKVQECTFQNVSGINLLCSNTRKVTVEKSEFRSKDNGSSKAVLVFSDKLMNYTELRVESTVFEGNTWVVNYFNDQVPSTSSAVNCGSAVSVCHLNKGNSTIKILNSTFIGNKAAQGASVCVSIGSNHTFSQIHINRGLFSGGRLNYTWSMNELKEMPAGGAMAMFIQGKKYKIVITDSNFTNNYGPNGGAVFIDYTLSQGSSIILNCIFKNNNGSSGGALMLTSSGIPEETFVELKNSTFIGNRGMIGGAILSHRVSINMIDSVTVSENTTPLGNGGGIALVYSEIFVDGSLKILNNSAGVDGGGIYMSSESRISMRKNTKSSLLEIIGNSAKTFGGGMYVYSLYYENIFLNWDSSVKDNQRHCFLIGKENSTIRILNNTAGRGNGTCAGNTVYTHLLGKCFDKKYIKGTLICDNGTCDADTRENSFLFDLGKYDYFVCNDSFFNQADRHDKFRINMSHFCNATSKPTLDNLNTRHVTYSAVTELHKDHEAINKFYFVYPGYTFQVKISSKDDFSHFVVTHANLIGKVYADGAKKVERMYNPISFNGNQQLSFLTNYTSNITIKSGWKGLGVICVESIGDFYKKSACIGIIMGNCPPGYTFKVDECLCDRQQDNGYTCIDEAIQIKPGKYLRSIETGQLFSASCLWFRCKCYFGANPGDCVYNPLNPDKQCGKGLTGPLCGKCLDNKTLFISPFLNNLNTYSSCIDCENPAGMIILFFLIVIVMMFIIMVFRVNLFGDYWRSVIFYANILYLILVNSSPYISPTMNNLLAVPILPLNFLVTQMIPFCLHRGNSLLEIVLFHMTVPLVTAALFILMQRFLITKISWLSTRNIPTQIWSILLLTYTDLSIHAFMILSCPAVHNSNFWLYEGETVCFQGKHLIATAISILYLFILISIPLFLLFITFYSKQDFQFHHNITGGFKHKFRWWEIYKLFLRLVISIILSFMPDFVDSDILKFAVSILCLLTMIMNSLFQPANNQLSNHFESVCFLFLALTAIPQQHWNYNCFPTLPFVVGTVAILIFHKTPFWIKQILKIKAACQENNSKMGRIRKIFKIWDVKSTYELDAM